MRSGTTYLRRLLNSHRSLHVTQEFDLTEQRRTIQTMLCRLRTNKRFGDLSEKDSEAWSQDVSSRYVQMLIALELENSNKPRYGDKTPRNTFRMGELSKMFPGCVFVHVIRDGRAVAASLLERQRLDRRFRKKAWAPTSGGEAAASWRSAVIAGRDFGSSCPTRYHEIRYEDFSRRPEELVSTLFSFLGEVPDSGVQEVLRSFYPRPRDWRRTLAARDLASFSSDAAAIKLLKDLGYPHCPRS